MLMPQIPPKPSYFRVKVWRRLQAVGAVALKNAVYVLPNTDAAREDFEWMRREIVKDGGEATICEARLVDGLRDEEVQATFQAARDADYAGIGEGARKVARALPRGVVGAQRRAQVEVEVVRLRRRLIEVGKIDFFGAPGREAAEGLVSALEDRLRPGAGEGRRATRGVPLRDLQGRVWVTRTGVHIDRIASAWLIRRFVDPRARIRCVPAKGYRPKAREVRFDMFEAEFTHEGDQCTFEVLVARLGLDDRALVPIAEIVHDIDLKEAKYGRPEVAGIERLIAGIAMGHKDDAARLAQGGMVFDGLYEFHRRKKA
ncbi:MAG TPA: chromate resistance protein ChrB domain-containing protein [Candidatus Dormibacteraeota bacterium]|nr:chromate resistance protein ChrB domain-containing protein [Candidatus Dormibacteraeota bacterium]